MENRGCRREAASRRVSSCREPGRAGGSLGGGGGTGGRDRAPPPPPPPAEARGTSAQRPRPLPGRFRRDPRGGSAARRAPPPGGARQGGRPLRSAARCPRAAASAIFDRSNRLDASGGGLGPTRGASPPPRLLLAADPPRGSRRKRSGHEAQNIAALNRYVTVVSRLSHISLRRLRPADRGENRFGPGGRAAASLQAGTGPASRPSCPSSSTNPYKRIKDDYLLAAKIKMISCWRESRRPVARSACPPAPATPGRGAAAPRRPPDRPLHAA